MVVSASSLGTFNCSAPCPTSMLGTSGRSASGDRPSCGDRPSRGDRPSCGDVLRQPWRLTGDSIATSSKVD